MNFIDPVTQEQLATASGASVAAIRKIERDAQATARLATLHRLATVLGVPTTALPAASKVKPAMATDEPGSRAIRQALQPIRSVNGIVLAEDVATAPLLGSLRELLRAASRVYQGDDYDAVLRLVPVMLAESRVLARASEGDALLSAQSPLAQAYQLAGGCSPGCVILTWPPSLWTRRPAPPVTPETRSPPTLPWSRCWVLLRQAPLDEAEQFGPGRLPDNGYLTHGG